MSTDFISNHPNTNGLRGCHLFYSPRHQPTRLQELLTMAKIFIQFYPWPSGDRSSWYRTLPAVCNPHRLQQARRGDLIDIIYPSGTKVQAKIFCIQNNLTAETKIIQACPANFNRANCFIKGTLVPKNYKHLSIAIILMKYLY
mgnify:CR=1 FL=1